MTVGTYVKNKVCMAGQLAWAKWLIVRGWPKLGAACGMN